MENKFRERSPDRDSITTVCIENSNYEERCRDLKKLERLPGKVRHLPANVLFWRDTSANSDEDDVCYKLWLSLVTLCSMSETWRELGQSLGMSEDNLNYIEYTVKGDHVDTVLKVYAQDDKATLDSIIDALLQMKRFDIVSKLKDYIYELVKTVRIEADSGYPSISGKGCLKRCRIDLPPLLATKRKERFTSKLIQRSVRLSSKNNLNSSPILFLTFTEDGEETALKIIEQVKKWDDINHVDVITLSEKENREKVDKNADSFIRECFEKAYYVVPILTNGYLKAINSNQACLPSTTENVDFAYVPFIYSLIVHHYIHVTRCLNNKVRSVVPKNTNTRLMKITMYPELIPVTNEEKFDEFFKVYLTKIRNHDTVSEF